MLMELYSTILHVTLPTREGLYSVVLYALITGSIYRVQCPMPPCKSIYTYSYLLYSLYYYTVYIYYIAIYNILYNIYIRACVLLIYEIDYMY